jgi:hypothetical protein
MTIACQSANDPSTPGGVQQPSGLSAQNMTITPAVSPCYDPCTAYVDVTWINDSASTVIAGATVGITLDGVTPPGNSTTTPSDINIGSTFSYTFTLTGLLSSNTNIICPVPN